MPDISKLSGVDISAVAKLSGVASSAIAKVGGISKAAAAASPSKTADLVGWWDPAQSSVGDTTVTNLAYTKSYTPVDHYQSGTNGAEIVALSGLNCWYLDGANDRVITNNLNSSGTQWPLNTDQTTFTLEGWVRSNGSWINNGNWWNAGYNGAYRNRFYSNGRFWNYPRTSKATSGSFSTNTWHHICVTMTASGNNMDDMTVYKNGSQMQQFTNINRNPYQSGRTNFWGGFTSTRESGRFYMGMCRWYTSALTASEVAYNYNLEKSDYGY